MAEGKRSFSYTNEVPYEGTDYLLLVNNAVGLVRGHLRVCNTWSKRRAIRTQSFRRMKDHELSHPEIFIKNNLHTIWLNYAEFCF